MIDFWFDFASTYSYLAAMRIGDVAATRGVAVRWRAFLLGPIFAEQGWTTSPFNLYPAKGRNMWRDMERQCEAGGLALVRPDPFPQNSLHAARLAVATQAEPWHADLCRAIFAAEFGDGLDISQPHTLAQALERVGADAAWLERAGQQDAKDALKAQTGEAMAAGIYGAPSFTVGTELFWGNDRLEQALDWANGGATA